MTYIARSGRFRSVFHALAAAALGGCSADTSGDLDVCAGSGTFVLDGALASLTATRPMDYLELRRSSADYLGGSGLNYTPWHVVASTGARCATATDRPRCEAAVAALTADDAAMSAHMYTLAHAYPGGAALLLIYTRGDEVGSVTNAEEFARLFGPVDTVAEAAFLASKDEDIRVTCSRGASRVSGGWELFGGSVYDCQGPTRMWSVQVSTAGAVSATMTSSRAPSQHCAVPGRRPAGMVACDVSDESPTGAWLARAAQMEAAAVHAFDRLADELTALGAPAALVDAARASRDDEVRHADVMRAWCAREGVAVPAVEIAPVPARSRVDIAIENAVEGCVNETWAAMEALLQSRRLRDAARAAEMAAIADDEIRHAALAWDVAAWIDTTLTDDERARVAQARAEARARMSAALDPPEALCDAVGLAPARLARPVYEALLHALG